MPVTIDQTRESPARPKHLPALLGARSTALVAALTLGVAAVASGETFRVPIATGQTAALTESQEIFLEARPRNGEGLLGFARRLCGSTRFAPAVAEHNGGISRLLRGRSYRVPFELVLPEIQLELVAALFERDRAVMDGWEHRVASGRGRGRESLWHVAEWFTGRGENYRLIRAANELQDDDLEPDRLLIIPARLLRPAFRSALPPDSPYYLEYGKDPAGEYAIYRLKPGEALYSAVIVRFTGRVFADDVNALAAEVARRSGIRDVTDIPVGYAVKVPFDVLMPEFLPAGHPRRREYEEGLLASSQFSNRVRAARLQGVTLILDPGHGGKDVGASMGGVWESLYVYDITVRTKLLLESETAAEVIVTTRDGDEAVVPEQDVLPYSRSHRVLTSPEYPIEDSTVGVHLRWYLANSIFRRVTGSGADPAKTVFLSIHADSLHPSLRGAMAYIPGARYRGGTYAKKGAVYAARKEVREDPSVSLSRREAVKSEGLSRDLAHHIIDAFRASGLAVHPDKPVREKVVRHRRSWVPAVLRYNKVPALLLLEVCNLANASDRKLLQTRDFRQAVARAIVDGILDYYGYPQAGEAMKVASAGT